MREGSWFRVEMQDRGLGGSAKAIRGWIREPREPQVFHGRQQGVTEVFSAFCGHMKTHKEILETSWRTVSTVQVRDEGLNQGTGTGNGRGIGF